MPWPSSEGTGAPPRGSNLIVQSAEPIVVRVMEEPVKSTGVSDILVGALGLTGVMLLAALLLGLLLGGILIGIKKLRAKYRPRA